MKTITVEIPTDLIRHLLMKRFPSENFVELVMANKATLEAYIKDEVAKIIEKEAGR